MLGLAILLLFNLLGLLLQRWLHLPLPGNVIGLILFTLALALRVVKLEWVEATANFLLRHMMLFFVPFIIGTVVFLDILRDAWLAITAALVLSTFIAMAATGWCAQLLLRDKAPRHDA